MATVPGRHVRKIGEAAIELVEQQHWLDGVADPLQMAVTALFAAGGQFGRRVRDFLHGTWLGHPLHPLLTDIPLGAWTTALLLDALGTRRRGFSRAADHAIGVGLAGGVAAAVTGLTDWQHTRGGDRRLGVTHAFLNSAAMTAYALAWTLRRRGLAEPGRVLAGVGFIAAASAAYLGSSLVYRKRVGVDHAVRPEPSGEFVPVLRESELAEARPRRVEALGMSIVLVRRGSRVYALGDRCAHLGGPLSEGRVDGDALRCPWHGSLFALDDGRVLEGPSTYPQSCFEVRIRAGHVEVRAVGEG